MFWRNNYVFITLCVCCDIPRGMQPVRALLSYSVFLVLDNLPIFFRLLCWHWGKYNWPSDSIAIVTDVSKQMSKKSKNISGSLPFNNATTTNVQIRLYYFERQVHDLKVICGENDGRGPGI